MTNEPGFDHYRFNLEIGSFLHAGYGSGARLVRNLAIEMHPSDLRAGSYENYLADIICCFPWLKTLTLVVGHYGRKGQDLKFSEPIDLEETASRYLDAINGLTSKRSETVELSLFRSARFDGKKLRRIMERRVKRMPKCFEGYKRPRISAKIVVTEEVEKVFKELKMEYELVVAKGKIMEEAKPKQEDT
jgi:hypothetical protein